MDRQYPIHKDTANRHHTTLVCLLLVLSILCIYFQTAFHDFINYDDPDYIVENPHVRSGLSIESVKWALTESYRYNYFHPLSWLSHMLDIQIFGLNAGAHHLVSVLFHTASSLLLFALFNRMTGRLWESAVVAGLFAVHPLHVESVAWLSERKDVLSTFFFMTTVWVYVRYARKSSLPIYISLVVFYFLGLMSKPMLVSLPFVLLLLDLWPLGRMQLMNKKGEMDVGNCRKIISLLFEKAPLFLLAAGAALIAYSVQQNEGMVTSIPLAFRTANACISYMTYIVKMVWPLDLAIFYPYDFNPGWRQVMVSAVVVFFILFTVFWSFKKRTYLAVGLMWYLITLIPVSGLVQVGAQSLADRYTYIPLIGLFIVIVYGSADIAGRCRHGRRVHFAFFAAILAILTGLSFVQVRTWKNSITVFSQAIEVTQKNYLAHASLGAAFHERGQWQRAIFHTVESLRIKPDYTVAGKNLHMLLSWQGDPIEGLERLIEIMPGIPGLHYHLAKIHAHAGHGIEAERHFKQAVRLDPEFALALNDLGLSYTMQNRFSEAFSLFQKVITLHPEAPYTYYYVARLYAKQNNMDAARMWLERARERGFNDTALLRRDNWPDSMAEEKSPDNRDLE